MSDSPMGKVLWIRKAWGLKLNPFPSTAIARLGSEDDRENGLLFNPSVQANKVSEATDKFVIGSIFSGLKFGYLWSLGTGAGSDARGFGKSSMLQFLVEKVNSDWGRTAILEAGLDEDDARDEPAAAVLAAFDKGNSHSLPKNWGTTGIAYRGSKVTDDIRTWDQFFELAGGKYAGKGLIVDHQISSFGSAAVALGYSLNTIDPVEMGDVEGMLTALKPKLFAISSDVQPPLRALDTWLSIAWTGDGVQVVRDNADARYVVAEDGGELWIDSYTVAADAPHRDAAYAFLDYILQPEQAAKETEFCLFPHANDKATALLSDEVKNNEVIYPSAESLVKLEYAVNATYNSPERAETWARIKASA